MEQQRVWVPDPAEGFVLGKIVDIGLDEVTVQPNDSKKPRQTCSLDRLYTAEDHDNKDVDDNCKSLAHYYRQLNSFTVKWVGVLEVNVSYCQ